MHRWAYAWHQQTAILIVEMAKQKLEQGLSITESTDQSAESGLRPLLMTSSPTLADFLHLGGNQNIANTHCQQSLNAVFI